MATDTKKREKNFERSYSDKTGNVEISHGDEPVISYAITLPPEGETVPEGAVHPLVVAKAGMRYTCDILVGVMNAVLKAEGGTIEKAIAKGTETLKNLMGAAFKFRSASGQGGLSIEEEQAIIADTIVSLGKAPNVADAVAKVAAVYARTKQNAKGYTVRPDYNALKNVPQIKSALAQASKVENNLDELLSV